MIFRIALRMLASRRASKLAITDVARIRMRAIPTDIDTLMHINNGMYLSIMDLGRYDLLIRAGVYSTLRRLGVYPVVASETISFRRSIQLWQAFDLETRFIGMDDRAVYLEQRFVVDGEVYAKGFVRGRFLKRSGGTVSTAELSEVFGVDRLPVPEWLARWSDDAALPSPRAAAPSDWN